MERSTRNASPDASDVAWGAFALIRGAIEQRSHVWAFTRDRLVHFCPHTLGWRGCEAYVLALMLRQRQDEMTEGGTWQWVYRWHWLRLADLWAPVLRPGEWSTCGRAQPAPRDFLTQIACEAA